MNINKPSFLLYYDDWDFIKSLNSEQIGDLLKSLYALGREDVEAPDLDQITQVIYTVISKQIIRDADKYEKTVKERQKAGKAGGLKSGESRRKKQKNEQTKQTKQTQANEANASILEASNCNGSGIVPKNSFEANEANEPVSVSESVSESVSDSVSESESDTVYLSDVTDDEQTGSVARSYGALRNVRLTDEQFADIQRTYKDAGELIDRVSRWLPKAKNPHQDHYQLAQTFAKNDSWPKKPQPKPKKKRRPDPPMGDPIDHIPKAGKDLEKEPAKVPMPTRMENESVQDWFHRRDLLNSFPEPVQKRWIDFEETISIPERIFKIKLDSDKGTIFDGVLSAFDALQFDDISQDDDIWVPALTGPWMFFEAKKAGISNTLANILTEWFDWEADRSQITPYRNTEPLYTWLNKEFQKQNPKRSALRQPDPPMEEPDVIDW